MRHFFKVLVGDFARRLEIPPRFVKHILKEGCKSSDALAAASAKVILENPEGKTWSVELEETDYGMFLTTGWPKFVEDHSLKEFEFLVFRYNGDMCFMVLVFDKTACERTLLSSRTGVRDIENPPRKLTSDMFPSSKKEVSGGTLTEIVTNDNLIVTPSEVQIPDQSSIGMVRLQKSTAEDEHTLSQSFPGSQEAGGSKEGLEADSSLKGLIIDDKAKAIAHVMRRLHVDKVTVDLFCATLRLYKWNVDVAVQDFDVHRGDPQNQNQVLKRKKIVLQLDFVKGQLRRFFPPDDDFPAPESPKTSKAGKSNCEEPNLSEQQQEHDFTSVKRRCGDDLELCDLSHEKKRRIGKLQQGSPQNPQTPRRSPRLALLRNAKDSPNILKERAEVVEPSLTSSKDHAKHKADCGEQVIFLCKGPDDVVEEVLEERKGSSSQEYRKLKPAGGEVVFSEEPQLKPKNDDIGLNKVPQHNRGEGEDRMDPGNEGTCQEQTETSAGETCESFLRGSGGIGQSPLNIEVPTSSIVNDLSFTWKPSDSVSPLEKILLDIQQDNFTKTVSHIQEIIRSHPSDLLTAGVIETIVQKEILKGDSCLEDRDAQKIVNVLLEHARNIKAMHNSNMEMRKEEFTAKLQDQLKWQLTELEGAYTSLELAYEKATNDASIAFSALREHRKNLHALQNDIKNLQQSLVVKEDQMQALGCQIPELESAVQKSVKEKVRAQVVLKSYQQTLINVKERLASAQAGSLDLEALAKEEMEGIKKEIELSKGSLLKISIKK